MDLKSLIGKNISYLAHKKNIGVKELADMVGKKANTVSNYKNGKILPPIDVLVEMSKIFDVSLDALTTIDISETYPQPAQKKDVMYQIQELVSRVKDLESKYESVKK